METTYDKIIQTATELFMSKGYLGTSTRQLSQILGLTQPALYHYFKNKEQLYLAVIQDLSKNTRQELDSLRLQEKKPEVVLYDMAVYLKEQHPMDLQLMIHDIHHELSTTLQQAIFKEWQENYLQPFITFFETHQTFLKEELTAMQLARHFLNTVSPYIKKEPTTMASEVLPSLQLDQSIHLFLYGIWKEKN